MMVKRKKRVKSNSIKNNNSKNEKIFTIFLIIFAIIGLGLFIYWNFHDMTKQEKENLNKPLITKEEGVSIAKTFLQKYNLSENINEYSSSAAFETYPNEIAFLEKSYGKKNAKDYIESNNLSYNRLDIHFFKDSEKEEYFLSIDIINKKVVGFNRLVSENKKFSKNDLPKEEANEMLLEFFSKQGFSKEKLIQQDYSTETKNSRIAHQFTYKIINSDFNSTYGNSYLELKGEISGDKLTQFSYHVYVPEDFDRIISNQEGSGLLLAILSLLASLIMFILSFIVLIIKFRKKQLNWKFFLVISIIALIFLIFESLNNFPVIKFFYNPEISYPVYMAIALIVAIISAILSTCIIFLTGASGESLAKEIWSEKISDLTNYIKGKFFTKLTSYSIFRGYLVGMVFLGVVALIYLIGETYLGVWSLGSADNTPILIMPFLSVFIISLFGASIVEEFTFRLFGISFFKKYFKSTLIAIFIPTIIWAIGHSTYPVFPFYFRAIELTITGLFFGYFFLRYNITTTIAAHYFYDAIMIGFILFFSGSLFNIISMIFILILPLIIALIGLKKE